MTLEKTYAAKFHVPSENLDLISNGDLVRLSTLLEKYAPHDDTFELTKDGLQIVRASKPDVRQTYMLSMPGVCIVPQGSKSVSLAQQSFEYGEASMVVYGAEVPINIQVTKASKDKPYLCLVIPIDPQRLRELIIKVFPNGVPKMDQLRAAYVGESNPKIIKSSIRLMELIEQKEDADLLVPLVIDEILIRLLRSPVGPSIAQIGIMDSHAEKVAKAISWLKECYAKPVKMEDLARVAGMSVSSFHTHFKSVTDMSPLQFQKTLRLQEARNMMLTKMVDVSSASYEVGYSSPSQFSREYRRFFGVSPTKDIANVTGALH